MDGSWSSLSSASVRMSESTFSVVDTWDARWDMMGHGMNSTIYDMT